MVATIHKQGQAFSLPLDAKLLHRLQIDETTPLEVSCEGDAIVVRRAAAPITDAEFQAALDDANTRYGGMLRKLAE